MIKSKYDIVGVMSGTSLDGVDLTYVTLKYGSRWSFKIHAAETVEYPKVWKQKLSNLVNCDLNLLSKIDGEYTTYLAQIISDFRQKYQLKTIDAICSHGHTALHQPDQKLTYQIGNLDCLAQLTKQLVVCDFRVQDVLFGGQGAPLVPIGDRLLFSEFDYCVNLGGFANISSENKTNRIAYDICPVNIIMNHYTRKLELEYDKGGRLAKSGTLNLSLLKQLNQLDYYQQLPPKSLGLEWVDTKMFPILEASKLPINDMLRTIVEHVAIKIAHSIKLNSKALFTGGGTYNLFLLDRIKAQKEFKLVVPSKVLIEYKEALIFGLLGVLKLRGEVNCLSSVTGAKTDHSSGEIYYP